MWTDGEFHTESSKFFCKAKGKNARTKSVSEMKNSLSGLISRGKYQWTYQ